MTMIMIMMIINHDNDYYDYDNNEYNDNTREVLEAAGPLLSPLGLNLDVTALNRGVEYR